MGEQWRSFPLSKLEGFEGRVLGDLSAEEFESLRQWRWITDIQETAQPYIKDLRDAIMARIAHDEAVAKSTARLTLVELDPNWRDFVITEGPFRGQRLEDLSREDFEGTRPEAWLAQVERNWDHPNLTDECRRYYRAIRARLEHEKGQKELVGRAEVRSGADGHADQPAYAENPSAVLSDTDASHESKESAPETAKRPPPSSDILASLYSLLNRAVLLPIPRGKKKPIFARWQHTTYEDTQRPDYQHKLLCAIKRGGNIGVLLGPKSGRLFALDIDDNQVVKEFLNRYPWLAHTLQSRGKRGCQFWFRLKEGCEYPNAPAIVPLKHNDQPCGELRLGGDKGAQSVIFGLHPEGPQYEHNGKTPIEISLSDLHELTGWSENPTRLAEPKAETSSEHAGDRILEDQALFDELMRQTGAPAYFDRGKMIALNEPFWAKLTAGEQILVHEPDEGEFYQYQGDSGLYVLISDDYLRSWLATRIWRASQNWRSFAQLERFRGGRVLSGVIAHLRGETESRAFSQAPPEPVIHCQNCVLVLGAGGYQRKDFSPDFKSRNRSPVAFDVDAKCPRFETEVLGTVSADDKKLIQKMFGSMLLGYNVAQKILLLQGLSGTGKTTLALILQGIVGAENISELRTNHLDERFEIGRYLGKTLLVGVDVPADFLSGHTIGRLKGLTGGDFLDAEKKSSNRNFRLHGRFNVLVTSNSRLRVRLEGDQAAWRRRLLVVHYRQERTSKTVRDFDQVILHEEASGVLNWGLEGVRLLHDDLDRYGDILLTEAQRQSIENLLEESDSLRIFLMRHIVRTDGKEDLTVDEIVSAYLGFCVRRQWVPIAAGQVQRRLEPLMLEFFATVQDRHIERDGKDHRGFRHVRWRCEDETDPLEK
jgi:putative DNA primase/helicase